MPDSDENVTEADLALSDGRTLHLYDTNPDDADGRLAVFWHHGTPNIGPPPRPLFAAAARLNLRWVSYDRPGYGGSTPSPGRDVAAAAGDVSAIADALDIDHFAVMGHSGGGSHALACGALLPDRVLGVISVAGLAPFAAEGLDWFEGMSPSCAAELRAAAEGRAALHEYLESAAFDPDMFTPSDHAALSGAWAWLNDVAGPPALEAGPDGLLDDDRAYVAPWGFDPAQISTPILFLHGEQDRIAPISHSEWLVRCSPSAELRRCPDDGHISVLTASAGTLEWLCEHTDHAR